MTLHASFCPLDCPDFCSLEVEVEDDRVVSVDGSRVNPLTSGYICAKVRRLPEHMYGPDRLLYPAVRSGPKGAGEFRRVSWDEALAKVSEHLLDVRRRDGGEAILPFYYGGSNGLMTQGTTDARFFHRLGASRLALTVCAAPSGAAAMGLYGKMAGVALRDYVKAKLIVVWGCNPAVTGIHLMPILQEAQRRGGRLVVVDPRQTPVARRADLHLAVRPGTDLPVALALIRWLEANGAVDEAFVSASTVGWDQLRRRAEVWTLETAAEIAGIPASQIVELGRWYAASNPALIRCGWGLERNRNGGSAVAAVLALPAVAGKFGVRGGGYTMSNSTVWSLNSDSAVGEEPPSTRTINMNRLGEVLLANDQPVNALFVYNCNPLATMPNQERVRRGLMRSDLFTVVFDAVMTDTARFADVLLPATTFLEHAELAKSYGAMVVQDAPAIVGPAGEARSNYDVFAELCQVTGLARSGDPESATEIRAAIVSGFEAGNGSGLDAELEARRIAHPETGSTPIQFVGAFPLTPDRKVRLFPKELDDEAPEGLYAYRPDPATQDYPLALISPATKNTISSTFGQLKKTQVALKIHPSDAEPRGIRDRDRVRVFNDLGEVRCVVHTSSEVRPGVVCLPKGLWSHNTLSGNTSNALAPDSYSDLAEGACFNDARVQVERLGGSSLAGDG